MAIAQIKTLSFSVYGDGTSTQWVVDLTNYAPVGFNIVEVYTSSMENVPYWGNRPVVSDLPYVLNNSILTVTLPIAPPQWTPTFINPGYVPDPNTPPTETMTPAAVTFLVTISY